MMKKIFILINFSCLFICNAQNLGDLDTSFGNNGVTEYYIGGSNTPSLWKGFSGEKLTVLPDNRFFYTGSTHWGCNGTSGSNWGGILARFTKDGSPDITFNNPQSYYFVNKGSYNVIKLCNDGKYLVATSNGFQKIYLMEILTKILELTESQKTFLDIPIMTLRSYPMEDL